MGLLHHAEHPPKILLNSFYYVVGDGVLRFFLTGDDHFDALTFNTTTGGKFGPELLPQSVASDASDADLTAYERHGGKLILLHGTTDVTIPTGATAEYYRMLTAKMGQAAVDEFVRFYVIPGYGHGEGAFNAGFDALGVLDAWVGSGSAPQGLVAVDNNRRDKPRMRPMCRYPEWPRYQGGDPDAAASFRCVRD
jgi:feruloyl esterase